MKFVKHWKAILVLLLVFAAGGAAGSAATVVHFRSSFIRSLRVEHWVDEAMKAMNQDLKLTAEQQEPIRTITRETVLQFKNSFGFAIRESGTNLVAAWGRIDPVLTPEQRAIHRQKQQEFRDGVLRTMKVELPQP
ncbi:MAG: hypothetical protein J0M24_26685 [Verrucomicrobia bacterium]|nr:hypothetical protein [Verrucomicrobiota bacterium]